MIRFQCDDGAILSRSLARPSLRNEMECASKVVPQSEIRVTENVEHQGTSAAYLSDQLWPTSSGVDEDKGNHFGTVSTVFAIGGNCGKNVLQDQLNNPAIAHTFRCGLR